MSRTGAALLLPVLVAGCSSTNPPDRVADVAAAVWPDRGRPEIVMAKQPQPGKPAERYVPDCRRARLELGLAPATSLDDAIRLTMLAACG